MHINHQKLAYQLVGGNYMSGMCLKAGFLLRIVAKLFKVLHWVIPILLIVLITFDFAKVIVGQADDKAKKEATTKAVKRLIYAVIIFLVPTIVSMIFTKIGKSSTDTAHSGITATDYIRCWNYYYNQ